MTFAFDENVPYGPAIVKLLKAATFKGDHCFLSIKDEYGESTPDVEWIPKLKKISGGVAIVTHDTWIPRNPSERRVLKECGASFIALSRAWCKISHEDIQPKYVKIWPKVIKETQKASGSPKRFQLKPGSRDEPKLVELGDIV